MKLINQLSIKHKAYILVLLSVAVALILSIVANNGLRAIRSELNYLIFSSEIERYTNYLSIEEQKYRLNTNGSIYNLEAANNAYNTTTKYLNDLYLTLENTQGLVQSDLLNNYQQQIKSSTDRYKILYFKAVKLLTNLKKQATILESKGKEITLQMQGYVESKRVEVKDKMTKKTIEKINNGSNIWQYTYVTRLHEESYRLSPSEQVFTSFKKDFSFMMSEWERLKKMSDQKSEFQRLGSFKLASEKYEIAMHLWVDQNDQLVEQVLPEMKQLGATVISQAIESAKNSINLMSKMHDQLIMTLLFVSILIIILGFFLGSMIARSITTAVTSFKNGLLNFFQFINKQQDTVQAIHVEGRNEISMMADVVNAHILKIKDILKRKESYQQALLQWSKVDYQDDNLTMQRATELSAKALDISRVSIWLFDEDRKEIICENLYENDSSTHNSGDILTAQDYPNYFKALYLGKAMVIEDARNNKQTSEFKENYLIPLNIYSMLDLPIITDGKLVGVICHEATGKIKHWSQDEIDFADSMVSAISLSLEIKRRHIIQQELKEQKETFQYQACHDSLTNLPNRFLFNDRLDEFLKQAERNQSKMAVLFVDLDHFKGINDSMGHKVGDDLLIEVSQRIQRKIRQSDTLARIGGDEFSIILNNIRHLSL